MALNDLSEDLSDCHSSDDLFVDLSNDLSDDDLSVGLSDGLPLMAFDGL